MSALNKKSQPKAAPRKSVVAKKAVDVTRNLNYRVVMLASTLTRSANRDFALTSEMTVPIWRMLSVIGSRGPIALADVTAAIGVDKGWMSRTLVQLEAQGLVKRVPNHADARQFFLTLTSAGEEMHLRGSAISVARQRCLEAKFNEAEIKTMEGLLQRLQTAAEEMAADPGYLD